MTIMESAYVAALERKLIEAERALYGFRAIWNNISTELRLQEDRGTTDNPARKEGTSGLYPGQYTHDPTSECVE